MAPFTLSDADIEALTVGDPTAAVPPARLELGVSVHAVCTQAMNRGEFELRITGAPRTHTSMAGRFAHLLTATDRDWLPPRRYAPPRPTLDHQSRPHGVAMQPHRTSRVTRR
jgi:hypothetical protein